MVASRSDTKRRRRDSSPLDSNPKRTKVHAQRKFAQGVSSLSNLLNVTPVKEKSEKSRNNGLSSNPPPGSKGNENTESVKNGVTVGKRALPGRGAKKPSIEDMITFLCYRGTSALPPHLVHLNKAPSPEPHSHAVQGVSETSRGKLGDKASRDADKVNNKKSLKSAASVAQKALTAAQALKKKYQEQRIKKSTVSTLASKVKGTPMIRTTRSTASAIANLSSRSVSKKVIVKKPEVASSSKRKESLIKDDVGPRRSSKNSVQKTSGVNKSLISTPPVSGSRGGLRSSGQLVESPLQSNTRKLARSVSHKKKKKSSGTESKGSQPSKKVATSLSDFSSEDDQPLVKKPKPLVQVQKLIKKSIANIGRKIKMEPRRSTRGLCLSPLSSAPPTAKKTSNVNLHAQSPCRSVSSPSSKDNVKSKTSAKRNALITSKETNASSNKISTEIKKKESAVTPKSACMKMKKGYVMELVQVKSMENDPALETRSRRGSREIREIPADDKVSFSQSVLESPKVSGGDSKKRDSNKSADQSKKVVGTNSTPKSADIKHSPVVKSSSELSLSAVLKGPPDLRIPSSIKRPLTAVGITNPMAIAAAAAVICKTPVKPEEKGRSKDSFVAEDEAKKADVKGKETHTIQSKSHSKPVKMGIRSNIGPVMQDISSETSDGKKDSVSEQNKIQSCVKTKSDDTSDEDSKPIITMASKGKKRGKVKAELFDPQKVVSEEQESKPYRTSRRSGVRGRSDESSLQVSITRACKSEGLLRRSSDDESKVSQRVRRSTNRMLKKKSGSDDEGFNDTLLGKEPKIPVQAAQKASRTENIGEPDSGLRSKKSVSCDLKVLSSDKDILHRDSQRVSKHLSRSIKDDTSENEYSDTSLSAAKPSTRSATKSLPVKTTSAHSTRSRKKDFCDSTIVKSEQKWRGGSNDDTTDEEFDFVESDTPRAAKKRLKSVSCAERIQDTSTESSDGGSDEDFPLKVSKPSRQKQAPSKRSLKPIKTRKDSSESASSSQDHEDDTIDAKTRVTKKCCRNESKSKVLSKKLSVKLAGTSYKEMQVADNRDKKKKNFLEYHKKDKLKRDEDLDKRRLRSPRRSSRKNTKSRPSDNHNDFSGSEASSSESFSNQNRRVLRERRGFFSFAEVDPPSDSEEEVLAATKASLEMILHQQSSNSAPEEDLKIEIQLPESCVDLKHSIGSNTEPLVSVQGEKKAKIDRIQPKKSLSKKRVKAPSDVQPRLNEELEKTLLSINLSPELSKSFDKSPSEPGISPSDDISASKSTTAAFTESAPLSSLSSASTAEALPTLPLKQRKIMPKTNNGARDKSASPSTSASQPMQSTGCQLLSKDEEPKLLSSPSVPVSFSALSSSTGILGKGLPPTLKLLKPPHMPNVTSVSRPCSSSPLGYFPQSTLKSPGTSCNVMTNVSSHGLSNTTTLCTVSTIPSILGSTSTVSSAAPPLLSVPPHMQAAVPTQMTSVPIPSASVSASLPRPMGMPLSGPLPVSMSIPLTTQLGIPMQASGNVPLSVPMSGTMTLPLQVGPLPSGTSSATPFLLPVQSALTSMLAPGQTIMKKESGNLGGISNPVSNTSLMVGMNPLVVNSSRGAFILSAASTMTMTSSQQQIVPGPLMPSLLSLRLPDKPAGQQTIMANSPLYVPFAFGNAGIIQSQGQVQPQIQTMSGMSTITAMATNIHNTVATNIQSTAATNLQNSAPSSIHNAVTSNLQNVLPSNIQNVVSSGFPNVSTANIQIPVPINAQSTTNSISSAMTLTQPQGTGMGTGMKRQLVLATKNGPVSKLILSVGEDGSHVLAAANPNTIPASDGQTLMSAIQPVQSVQLSKMSGQTLSEAVNQGMLPKPNVSTRALSSPISSLPIKGLQSATVVSSGTPLINQTSLPNSLSQAISGSTSAVSQSFSSSVSSGKAQVPVIPMPVSSASPSPAMLSGKSGLTSASTTLPAFKGTSGATIILTSSAGVMSTCTVSSCSNSTVPSSSSLNVSANCMSTTVTACPPKSTFASSLNFSGRVSNLLAGDKPVTNLTSSGLTVDSRPCATVSISTPVSSVVTTSSNLFLEEKQVPSNAKAASMTKITPSCSFVPGSSRQVSKTNLSLPSSASSTSSVNVSSVTSSSRISGKSVDAVPLSVTNQNQPAVHAVSSRIPSAPAALAALKSPSGTSASTRAIAKTGSSRKPYSTAASYAAIRASDSPTVQEQNSVLSTPSASQKLAPVITSPAFKSSKSHLTHMKGTVSSKVTADTKTSSIPLPGSLAKDLVSTSPSVGHVESKRKGSEVELAPTHRTLSMLSTAFQGNIMIKDRKRDMVAKKVADVTGPSEKEGGIVNVEKSGLDSLAEVATSLAERSVEVSDKRVPEHSLWTNPAQILGQETIRVPGLQITANVGTSLPTKNELAKMKSGALLVDAKETRSASDVDKVSKGKGNLPPEESDLPSVSGLLASGKADTPRQKVQKWLDNRSSADVDHKGSCSLLSNGNICTCDVVEDISNLNSLAEVCVNMERIDSPPKDTMIKPGDELPSEKRKKQECVDDIQNLIQSSSMTGKSSLPRDSHQMKVTWQNAFGVKSPVRSSKSVVTSHSKQTVVSDDLKKFQQSGCEVVEKARKTALGKLDESPVRASSNNPTGNKQGEESECISAHFANEPVQMKKVAQRRSILSRAVDSAHHSLGNKAFSPDNERSVYAFEADTDSPPVSQPFRRRSKTLSRSDEEDSTSVGSTTTPVAVHVSKDPVFVPIQIEGDDNPVNLSEKNGVISTTPPNETSDVYYIPLCGQDGNEGDVRAVAVRLGKEGPNNRVVMSAKLVKKPPTFKHPSDSNEDGLPSKRAKIDSVFSAQHPKDLDASSSSNIVRSKVQCESIASDQKLLLEKTKQNIKEASRSSTADSSSEETFLLHVPPSSKDTRECRSSMSPTSSRNRSPTSDKTSPSTSLSRSKGHGRLKRQPSMDSDGSEKAKSSRRGSKSKSASSLRASPSPSLPSTSSTSSGPSRPSQKSKRSYNGPVPGNVSEAPVFHPTEKEFQDPYSYIEKIRPVAEKYGLCRIVAPHSFKPDCNVEDDIRFTADNQYVHKMMDRWGPNAKEMRAIVKYIAQHNIHLKHAPLVGGIELDLPRLYTTVQNFGGLMEVMDKKRWVKVAETMRIPKSAQDRASKLDEVYCKCLLPYETLKTTERDNLFEMVEVEWEMRKERRDKRLAASAASPDQPGSEGQQDEEDEDDEEEEDDEEDECIVKGRSMPLTTFYRTARNTTHMWFKGSSPSASEVEHEFWRHVRDRNFHICVNSGSVDCSDPPYGFPTRNSPFAKHPWNLKVFSNSDGSVLRSLGSVIGVTVPTLHFGMVFTTCCWYRDPHGLPWIEYLHTGAKKIWYGVPEHGAEKFRSAMQEVAPHYVRKKALWLASDTAMIPPNMLTERKVPLCRTVQEPGQFIVVFPKAHTSSVATGYIVSESVSFAPASWLSSAMESFKEMQKCNEPPLFSLDKLIFAIAEDSRSSLHVLNTILPCTMEILEREITYQQELKKKGVKMSERAERKNKLSGKKLKLSKESEDSEVMECDVCSTSLYLSMVVNTEDDSGYCLVHASLYIEQGKLNPSQCKLLYTYTQNDLHEFCQNLLDRIETKSGKKGNFSSNNSDSGSSASTSTTRH